VRTYVLHYISVLKCNFVSSEFQSADIRAAA